MDWKACNKTLGALQLKNIESQTERDTLKKKLDCMEFMQQKLIECMKGYKFMRGANDPKTSLRGAVVKAVDAKNITVRRPMASADVKVSWEDFLRFHPNNFDEVVQMFFTKPAVGKGANTLSMKDRFEATKGAAYVMQMIVQRVCKDSNSTIALQAVSRSHFLIKEFLKGLPQESRSNYMRRAKDFFPDIDLGELDPNSAMDSF